MISDLIEFGKWLVENNQDDFGKITKDDDFILSIHYINNIFSLNKEFIRKSEFDYTLFDEYSQFNNDFLISTDQRFIIPSKSNLLGLSPFFIKLDNDFLKKGVIDDKKTKKFKDKIKRSIKSNSNNKEFISVLSTIFSDYSNFLDSCPISNQQKTKFNDFFKNNSFEDIKLLIVDYYKFILENADLIIDEIIRFKGSDNFDKKLRSNFYLTCYFNNDLDLINDLFIFYSKIFKKRDEKVKDYDDGVCAFCGNSNITYSSLGSFVLSDIYSFKYSSKMNNSRLRLCKSCNSYLRVAEDKLKQILPGPMMIIPKLKNGNEYSKFLKVTNIDLGSFSKINKFLNESSENFTFDLIFYNEGKGNTYIIKKYIENYQAFLCDFKNDIKLYEDNQFNYLFNDKYVIDKEKDKIFINNLFDLQYIFKSFFIKIEEDTIRYPALYNFHDIYIKDLTGKTGIFNGFDSKTVSLFSMYMESIFNFIYEFNIESLNSNILNEIVLNNLIKLQRNSFKGKFRIHILKNLNYYYMIKKEFLGDSMLDKNNVLQLKDIFLKYNKYNKNPIDLDDKNKIFNILDEDVSLKYYLIGQFISLLDSSKRANNKNGEIFSNYILNVNKNNIKKLFVTEVLQKNNFYIENMNKKGKFLFKILEKDLIHLFNEEKYSFEDYLLLLFTGYYTENILSSSYGLN